MNTFLLLLLALTPGIILMVFILYMDRNEREPLGQVLKVMLLGALSVVPAAFAEWGLAQLPIYSTNTITNAVIVAFIQVAWVEELCKLGVVLLVVWNNKHFNEENDGIVYVGASALGFAMLENVAYVLRLGMTTGILRAITAMPLHCFTGVLMGYYTGLAKFAVTKKERKQKILKGFFLAYVTHATYNALLLTRTPIAVLILPLLIGLIVFGIRFLKQGRRLSLNRSEALSKNDEWNSYELKTSEYKTEPEPDERQQILNRTNPKNQTWKLIISRTLLILCGLLWALMTLGMILNYQQFKSQAAEIIMGGILVSVFPILIGILLDVSYRKKQKFYQNLKEEENKEPESEEPGPSSLWPSAQEELSISLPGQYWRMLTGRSLLIISALFWAVVILTVIAKFPSENGQEFSILMGAWVIGFFPLYTGFLLEDSYRKRNKRFKILFRRFPDAQVPPELLTTSPPGQGWKIVVSRFLLGLTILYWVALFMMHFFSKTSSTNLIDVILSGLLTTIVPIVTALTLEGSYRKKQRVFQAFQDKIAAEPLVRKERLTQW